MGSRKSKSAKRRRTLRAERLAPRPAKRGTQQVEERPDAVLSTLKPKPCTDESIVDLAVFSQAPRNELSSQLQVQAVAVSDALAQVNRGDFDAAWECVKNIPRTSPYADWRLFLRGLVAFYERDAESARENWRRLDRSRRPARIAATLLVAETGQPLDPEMPAPPEQLVEAVKDLRLHRGALAAARRIAGVRHRDRDTSFSAAQVAMLTEFRDQYRRIDDGFVTRFSQACMRVAFFQANRSAFELLKKKVPGPAHDPRWNLHHVLYLAQFEGAADLRERAAKEYLDNDLPKLTHLPGELADALASCILLLQAVVERSERARAWTPFAFREDPPELKGVESKLREAIKRYAGNRKAHDELISVLQRQLDDGDLSKSRQATVTKQLIRAKEGLVKTFPNEVETALWLIDHYFDIDELERAEALVQQLGSQRVNDPRAKALAFKLKVREAMRLSRRKSSLLDARKALDVAESIWPTWLSRDWLPFLKAAIARRAGDDVEFEQLSKAARESCGVAEWVGDVMTFAALQQMHLPGAELRPLREAIDGYARQARDLPLTELLALGSFFWDLTRTGLRHKGYRLQASKFGKVLCKRFKKGALPTVNGNLFDALDWAAEHRFWQSGYTNPIPRWFAPLAAGQPRVAAAGLQWHVGQRYSGFEIAELRSFADVLEQAARSESDPFYRHRFDRTAQDARVAVAELEAWQRDRTRFSPFPGRFMDDDDDDDPYEGQCDCPACRAARRREASGRASRPGPARPTLFDVDGDLDDDSDDDEFDDDEFDDGEFDDGEFDDGEFDDGEFDGEIPPVVVKVLERLGPDGIAELGRRMERAMAECQGSPDELSPLEVMTPLFLEAGLSAMDAVEFMEATRKRAEALGVGANAGRDPSARMDAAERRALRAQRRKNAKKKNKRR